MSLIQQELIRQITEDRTRSAARHARLRAARPTMEDVVIRTAGERDAERLRRLAQLDSARVPEGPTLVAEHDGVLVAALPLRGGRALADPFLHSADFVRLLELRASQLRPVL
jgi:hypothetical protein